MQSKCLKTVKLIDLKFSSSFLSFDHSVQTFNYFFAEFLDFKLESQSFLAISFEIAKNLTDFLFQLIQLGVVAF